MAIVKTLKHELEYDTETGQAIFNGRNKTAKSPVHKSFPERLIFNSVSSKIEENTLELSPLDEIENTTLNLGSGKIVEHTLEM